VLDAVCPPYGGDRLGGVSNIQLFLMIPVGNEGSGGRNYPGGKSGSAVQGSG